MAVLLKDVWSSLGQGEIQRTQHQFTVQRSTHLLNAKTLSAATQKSAQKLLKKKVRSWKTVPDRARKIAREVP